MISISQTFFRYSKCICIQNKLFYYVRVTGNQLILMPMNLYNIYFKNNLFISHRDIDILEYSYLNFFFVITISYSTKQNDIDNQIYIFEEAYCVCYKSCWYSKIGF